jgi:hypothetical protein
MRQHVVLFNVVGLTFAMLLGISCCGQVTGGGRGDIFVWTLFSGLLLAGGSIANLTRRRFSLWPTIAVIGGYCITVFLLPFGIWGIVALVAEQKRSRNRSC